VNLKTRRAEILLRLTSNSMMRSSLWSVFGNFYFCIHDINIHMQNGDTYIQGLSYIMWNDELLISLPWLLIYLILSVFLLMNLCLISQYFTFADQRAEFICGIEKNVS
jgi:hypothetical protein